VREAHELTCPLFDRERTFKVVEIRRGEARTRGVDVNPRRLRSKAKASIIALRAVFDGL
jgi:hypothetical protein